MLVFMLWALTPSDASSIPARVQQVPTPAMTVHQESYFTFNHGKPFLAEQDPLTGAILNLKTTPVLQDDYVYEEEEEGEPIDRKDNTKIFTRNDIAQPSKDPDLHKFLNLPVHYSSSGKFPLISSSYANTKVQGHGASTYSNHRLSPTTSSSTVSPSYYPLKTSTSTTTEGTRPTTTSTTTTSTTTTTTQKPTTKQTTTKPPPSYEYEYEYEYDHEPEREPDKKTTTHNILDFFDRDYELLGASEEEKKTTKVENLTTTTSEKPKTDISKTEKPKTDVVMVAPNTNIFIPPDYLLKPSTTERENRTELRETTTVKVSTTTEVFTTTTVAQNKLESNTERLKPSQNLSDKVPQSSESFGENEKLEHGSFGLKLTTKDKPEVTTRRAETLPPTLRPVDKKPIVFFPTRLPDENDYNETYVYSVSEENEPKTQSPIQKKPIQNPYDDLRPPEVPPARPSEHHYPYQRPGSRPEEILPQHNGHFNPYQRPPTMVPTQILPPQRPKDTHYQRPQERPYSEPLPYRPVEQNRPQNNPGIRPPVYMQENKPMEQTSHRPSQPTQTWSGDSRPQDDNSPKPEPQPFVTLPPKPSTRPGESISILLSRPQVYPHRQEPQTRPTEPVQQTRAPDTVQKPTDQRYPPYQHVRPQEPEPKPFFTEYRPQNPRPEPGRPPLAIPDFVKNHEPQGVTEHQPEGVSFNNNKQYPQFNQPSKVESHFIKVSPGQESPSYALQTSFSIGVPPAEEAPQGVPTSNPGKPSPPGSQGVGQVLFPDEEEKRPWAFQEDKRPVLHEAEKYPRPSWESHLKPPLAFNHLRKEPYSHKRPKPRPDLPNILPQFRPNAKVGHAEPQIYFKTPLDTLQPPPLPRPQFLRAESEEEKLPVHRRNGQSTRVTPVQTVHVPKRGALRSEDEKTDPVFVVYPSNNVQDGVVVGTRGPQRPLPPDNLEIEDSFPLDSNKNFQARVDTPILKGKITSKPIIKNEFPYPLIKPAEQEEKVITTVTKEYTAFSPTVSPTEKEHDTEINVIPYLQDYQPFATKKPSPQPPAWNTGNDTKPISVTLKTQKTEVTTSKIDNHKLHTQTSEIPKPQDFQAPFYASLTAPNQGWSVLRPRPDPEKEEETTTVKTVEEQDGKFDIQNFKPQLFGGFKPIIPPTMEQKETEKEENDNI